MGLLYCALQAFISNDQASARQIVKEDNSIDALHTQVFRDLISYMMEYPRTITRTTRLLWVAHNLERSADRVTNICEWVVLVFTGKLEELSVSKY
jgi:phosphate transport system protein